MKNLICIVLLFLGTQACGVNSPEDIKSNSSNGRMTKVVIDNSKPRLDNNGEEINAHAGNVMYHKGKYYWFGEHKTPGNHINGEFELHTSLFGVRCYSSSDMIHWTNEGIALPVSDEPGNPIEKGCKLERPKVVYNEKTGKFVMWFHLNYKGEYFSSALSGIAVADNITGPYKFVKCMRPNKNVWPVNVTDYHKRTDNIPHDIKFDGGSIPNGITLDQGPNGNLLGRDFPNGQMARDMTLFVDDDKKGYLVYSSEENATLHIAQLNDEYTDVSGKFIRLFPGKFHEAPVMFKIVDTYYIISSGCTGWIANRARLSKSKDIFGTWTEHDTPCRGAGAENTFGSQSTCVLRIPGEGLNYVFMANVWEPYVYQPKNNPQHLWLPIKFSGEGPILEYQEKWTLEIPNNENQ